MILMRWVSKSSHEGWVGERVGWDHMKIKFMIITTLFPFLDPVMNMILGFVLNYFEEGVKYQAKERKFFESEYTCKKSRGCW